MVRYSSRVANILRRARAGQTLPRIRFRRSMYATRGIRRSMISRTPVHHFMRRGNLLLYQLTSNTAGETSTGFISGGNSFSMNSGGANPASCSITNSTEFTNLYDQYRLNKVVLEYKWSLGNTALGGVPADNIMGNPPILYIYNDYDDRVAPTYQEVMEQGRCKKVVLTPNKIVRMSVRPALLTQLFNGGDSLKWKQWINTNNPIAPHFGQKFGVHYQGSQAYGVLSIIPTFYFSCKGIK